MPPFPLFSPVAPRAADTYRAELRLAGQERCGILDASMGPALRCLVLACVCAAPSLAHAAERWVKVSAGHFTVLTATDESVARQWAGELVEFSRALQAIVPVPKDRLQPVTVVLFKNDRAIEPYLPRENGRPSPIAGLFARTNDINTIMLSLARREREARHIIFHETVHWHLDALGQSLPLWLGEGLADLFANFEVLDGERSQFGGVLPGHVELLSAGRLLPIPQLMTTVDGTVLDHESRRGNAFYAGSWALVHFLLLAENAPGSAGLQRFIALPRATLPAEEAFRQAFGRGYAECETQLRRYLRERSFKTFVQPHASVAVAASVSGAAPGEIELATGALLLRSRGATAAEPSLRRATELAPRDPRAWELLGVALGNRATALGDSALMDTAAAQFRRAIEIEPRKISHYEGLANLVYFMASFRPEDAALLGRGWALAPDNLTLEAGVAACALRAGDAETGRRHLQRIAALESHSSAAGPRQALRILDREHLRAELAEAQQLTASGHYRDAVAVLERALSRDLPPAERQMVIGLRRGLDGLVR